MAYNVKTPAGGTAGAFGKGVDFAADTPEIAPTPQQVQIARLRKQFVFSPALAGAVAALAYPHVDSWRGAR
jgi:hypothetical protein